MNLPKEQHPASQTTQTAQHPEFSLERVSRLISALEQELANAPPGIANVHDLREEIDTLKRVLAAPADQNEAIRERQHSILNALQNITEKAESEVLKDSPYIAEIGRILGLV